MRCAAAAVVIGLSLLAFAVSAAAQPPESVTMDRAVDQFGTPSYDHNCPDGTITLAWKGKGEGPQWQPGWRARTAQYQRVGSRGVSGGKGTVVMKFDRDGKLVWSRQLR